MALEVGSRLGHYEVTVLIGEGGMGQVYQATDTKLKRQVALKILPEAFAADPERLARFQREAEVLASLNHPGIAAIYGLEEAGDTRALVLELVEGPTLADRIKRGPIPLDEALPIAKQIAEALEAAHEAGVIHRDLKPANIKVRDDGTVKVLDFGLAKALDPSPVGDPSQSPTLTAAATQMGVIMGTAAYMSPEQARGKRTDRRADIWAFGAVLFEMLSGQRAFEGEDVSVTLANVINKSPDWKQLPTGMSPTLQTYLRRCLDKDPAHRVQAVGDVRLAMEGAFDTRTGPESGQGFVSQPHRWQRSLVWFAGGVIGGITGALVVWSMSRPPVVLPTRSTVMLPSGVTASGKVSLSQDGRTLAFHGVRGNESRTYTRALDQLDAVPLPTGARTAAPLAFSPDGEMLLVSGVRTDGVTPLGATVSRVPLDGGPSTVIASSEGGADWGRDGTVVLGGISTGLRLITPSGGESKELTTLHDGEVGHVTPSFLPDGRAVLFTIWGGNTASARIAVYDPESGERITLFEGTTPKFAASGHLIFWRDSTLWAVAFDPDRLEARGTPVAVVEGVTNITPVSGGAYDLGEDGVRVYLPESPTTTSTLGWVARNGEMASVVVEAPHIAMPRLSPDGTRVAFARLARFRGFGDQWLLDLETGRDTRLTETGEATEYSAWMPDGATLTFSDMRSGNIQLYSRPVDLSRESKLLLSTAGMGIPGSWTSDGQTLVYYEVVDGQRDIWTLPTGAAPEPFLATEFSERAPKLSPNEKWLAYVSDHVGEDRVFVQPFPAGGPVFPVSVGQGTEPVWSRDGRELFYRSGDQLWVTDVETESGFSAGTPRLLFETPYADNDNGVASYDVSLDGQRFLMVREDRAEQDRPFVLVQNWFEELTRLVPVD